jgi:hypothetical protein
MENGHGSAAASASASSSAETARDETAPAGSSIDEDDAAQEADEEDEDEDDEVESGELQHPGTVWPFRKLRRRWRRRVRASKTVADIALSARRLRMALAEANIVMLGPTLEPRRWRRRKVKGST